MQKLLLLIFCSIFLGCNTYITQPIAKLIQNAWIRTPYDFDNQEKWEFDGKFLAISDSNRSDRYQYTVGNNIIKDYVYIILNDTSHIQWDTTISRWHIVKLTKKQLYLISESDNTSGAFHRTFVSEDF